VFFVLGLSIVLAALLLCNSCTSVISSLTWRMLGPRAARHLSAASCASIIFLLRTFPIVLGIVWVCLLLIPAYLEHEPRDGHEPVSLKLAIIASASAISLALALFRGLAAWRATSRLNSDWLRHAEPIKLPQVKIPSYRIQHQFPVIAIVGVLRPRLFIAEQVLSSLRHDELIAAIEHEVGHVVANDNLRRGLMRACRDVLVMIPKGQLLDRAWIEASEAAADEYAAGRGRRVALDLASALVKIARLIPAGMKPAMPAGAFLISAHEEGSGVKARVRRLMQLADQKRTGEGRALISRIPMWIPIVLTILVAALAANEPHVLATVHTLIEASVHLLS
jgi:beta-lactamase regulating signal transducer with metallopeptidase domain